MFLNGGRLDNPLRSWKYPDTTANGVFAEAKNKGLPHGKISTLPRDCPYPDSGHVFGTCRLFYQGVVSKSGRAFGRHDKDGADRHALQQRHGKIGICCRG